MIGVFSRSVRTQNPLPQCFNWGWLGVCIAFVGFAPVAVGDERREHFENKIRPVLVAHCLECHGNDPDDLGGGLSLRSAQAMRDGGDTGPAIIGDDSSVSLLVKALRYDSEIKMPPDGKLADEVIEDFATWIDQGAFDPRGDEVSPSKPARDFAAERRHWAFQPLATSTRRLPPSGSGAIDAFVSEQLHAQGLTRSKTAAPATQLRRLCYDLTGLPPTPQQLQAFLANPSEEHYQRTVDELLASPRFGEHWGRHWLDVARYADSNGSDFNATFHHAWRYRDYVIQAFNEDKPFDQFVTEQIAGDLLTSNDPDIRASQLIATGFLMLGPKMLSERDKDKLQMDVVDDQIDTVGRAFMGLTLGCARCHDHKFDPVPTSDYYALAGIFRSTEVLEGEIQKYVSDWIEIPLPADEQLITAAQQYEQKEKELATAVKKLESRHKVALERAAKNEVGTVIDDAQAMRQGTWVESTYIQPFIGKGYLHDDNRNKGECSLSFRTLLPSGRYQLSIAYSASANRSRQTQIEVRWASSTQVFEVDQSKQPSDSPWQTFGEVTIDQMTEMEVVIKNAGTDGYVIADAIRFVQTDTQGRPEARQVNTKLVQHAENLKQELEQTRQELIALRANKPAPAPKAMAVRDAKTPEDAFVCIRGEVHLRGEQIPRGFLGACQPASQDNVASGHTTLALPADQSGRLQLAQWLCDPDHPLTSRVIVNRIWMHLMGEGLVRTVDNFGLLGDRPSHPELLDRLASDFLRNGWSIKRTIRDIVCSDTYRQETSADAAGLAADPENRWLWRMHRKRLGAEALRDTVLVASQTLDTSPSVAPVGSYGTLVSENVADAKIVKTAESQRRSVYLPVIRGQLHELLATFDFADPDLLVGKRERTNVPSQALLLLNGPWIREQARLIAGDLSTSSPDKQAFVQAAYLHLFSRPVTAGEQQQMERFLETDHAARREQVIAAMIGSSEFRLLD